MSLVSHLLSFQFLFFFRLNLYSLSSFAPEFIRKKYSLSSSKYKRLCSPAPWFTSKFNKAQRVNDLLKVINVAVPAVEFTSDSWSIVVWKNLIKLCISKEEIMQLVVSFLKRVWTVYFQSFQIR